MSKPVRASLRWCPPAPGVEHPTLPVIEGGQIGYAVIMVRMGMREQHGVERAASRIDELIAHVRSGIDPAMGIVLPQQDRRPPPPVPWLGRVAVSPAAIRQRHAAGNAPAENGNPHPVDSGPETLLKRRKKLSADTFAKTPSDIY